MLADPGLTDHDRSHRSLTEDEVRYWRSLPAAQQPAWDGWLLHRMRRELTLAPALVGWEEVRSLRALLADVARGERQVLQAGDCAEDPADCAPDVLDRKLDLFDVLAGAMRPDLPVVRVGRLAGQFAKPRSRATEVCDGVELPAFRGHLVNSPQPDPLLRRADPLRLVSCYQAAARAVAYLHAADREVWTSHEALLLDYELPLVRRTDAGPAVLTSTHWPWIGDRTRQVDGAHVRLLAAVDNPVACKVGPTTTVDELLALCRVLDPDRSPGRLTLITRLGADLVADRLPPLVAAVRAAGHPVVWLCDPMHANTTTAPGGQKTRLVETVLREVRHFREAVRAEGAHPGGLHLETTPDPVAECVADVRDLDRVGIPGTPDYRSFCDPRLNPGQALSVVEAWSAVGQLTSGN
ncbi:3-deoxy-7-phosphoheptulonate synthase [Saccharothrix sp. ALI-22-I]|uniref:3-deoxy-7-phosphoheptulonate synthase n=1 Tax=Saccharothrix sp. ALI-22-I TaxID=1933778 RepID=UPI001EE76897|nr:3-deoxy-7-phosphoheptulonate synthase [Saccharothrix sp. ALI-22-I]